MELRQEELEAHTAHQFPLVPYDEKDDFDSFLNHFERVAGLNKWKRSSWAARLVALLQGRARDACLRLQPEQLHDYDILKAALLYEFRLDADSYRKRFRSMRKLAEETFDQFLGRLKVCFSRWCVAAGRDESDAEDIKDLVLQEQFLTTLNPDLVTEVRREEPNRVEDVAHITTKIVNARRAGRMAEAEFRVSKKGSRVSDRSFNLGAEKKGPPHGRVAVDIVGPIAPASESGCRYILTMVDYATRYPEAVPLKDITSESVAEALFNMWTRTGIPSEVLTDRGTQFTSQVMQEVYRLLSVRGLTTTPYHAQCNGLVERFNATLKTMLRRLSHERPRAWDRWIPALLFAYREVPQESTGYSPFELLYGRTVRGPMQILREHWLHPERSEVQTAAEYVVDLRNKIAESCTLAQQNLEKAARRYKRHFDAKAKRREFAEGSRVLLLRPSKHNKLELEWQGPYTVLRRVGLADYCVRVGTKEKLYHANLLKQYVERIPQMSLAIAVVDDGEIWEETRTVERDIPLIPLEASEGPEDVVVDPTNPSLKEAVLKLVREFGDVLTDLPGRTNLETCSLQLNSDTPLRTKQYPLPYSQREVIQEEVDQMLKMGVIEPSSSPYSSPIVLVKKRDGKVRFCVDFRRVNKVTTFDAEPMPDVEALFAKLAGKRVFSKLDLSKGYWQIPMEEADRPKTAFSTPQGHFQWRVMPFGLKTAGAVFSRMMRKLILPLGLPEVDNFMDDMIIASVDEASHLPLLRAVFHRLRECSLTARPAKCYLGHKELDYLGHHVGDSKIWPDDEKMEKIHNATRPQTKRQLRGFLGLVGYYRRFVPQFAEIALPLTDRTKGKEPAHVKWDESCERAFLQLKQVLCSRPVCLLPDLSKPFVLRTDASAVGLGALLLQDHGMGPQPVACASKKLNAAERNYPTIERECLALVWGIQKFEPYLYGKPFVVQTDHAPLQYLDRARTVSGRLTRSKRSVPEKACSTCQLRNFAIDASAQRQPEQSSREETNERSGRGPWSL
ncbi:uncharacterized protein LOC143293089 [Babylonia areolata]|uniref:uncharacterized protein LOC143293089 n=1 Tax=Babylonia areolata TaxID=304850 RepID=UPI003FCF8CD6